MGADPVVMWLCNAVRILQRRVDELEPVPMEATTLCLAELVPRPCAPGVWEQPPEVANDLSTPGTVTHLVGTSTAELPACEATAEDWQTWRDDTGSKGPVTGAAENIGESTSETSSVYSDYSDDGSEVVERLSIELNKRTKELKAANVLLEQWRATGAAASGTVAEGVGQVCSRQRSGHGLATPQRSAEGAGQVCSRQRSGHGQAAPQRPAQLKKVRFAVEEASGDVLDEEGGSSSSSSNVNLTRPDPVSARAEQPKSRQDFFWTPPSTGRIKLSATGSRECDEVPTTVGASTPTSFTALLESLIADKLAAAPARVGKVEEVMTKHGAVCQGHAKWLDDQGKEMQALRKEITELKSASPPR